MLNLGLANIARAAAQAVDRCPGGDSLALRQRLLVSRPSLFQPFPRAGLGTTESPT